MKLPYFGVDGEERLLVEMSTNENVAIGSLPPTSTSPFWCSGMVSCFSLIPELRLFSLISLIPHCVHKPLQHPLPCVVHRPSFINRLTPRSTCQSVSQSVSHYFTDTVTFRVVLHFFPLCSKNCYCVRSVPFITPSRTPSLTRLLFSLSMPKESN
jgi:hypothetical protein